MSTDWARFVGIKAVKIAGFVVLALIAAIILVGLLTNKPIKIWVIEFNRRDTAIKYITATNHDTQYINKHNTVYLNSEYKTGKKKSEVTQNNKFGDNNQSSISGGNNHTVTGNGNSIGINGDVNVGIVQRRLDGSMQVKLLKRLADTLQANNLSNSTEITIGFTMGNEEAMNFALEVGNFLLRNGYNVNKNIGPTIGNEGKGFWIKPSEKKLFIDVGVASHNGYT